MGGGMSQVEVTQPNGGKATYNVPTKQVPWLLDRMAQSQAAMAQESQQSQQSQQSAPPVVPAPATPAALTPAAPAPAPVAAQPTPPAPAPTPRPGILTDLASRHPEVAAALDGPTGTPEFGTIREHTQVVLDNFERSGATTGVPELDAVMPTILALHDIGKPAAIAKRNKNLQHQETLPILERVMRAEGATDQQIAFAKALVDQDIIGQLVKGQIDVETAYRQLALQGNAAGLTQQQFHNIALAMYNADAGSYSRLSHLFDDKGRLTNVDARVLEEAVHGDVSSIPWSEDYRPSGQQSADQGDAGGFVYTHSSAYDFSRFDESKDAQNNLAGPGAYLLPPGQEHIADVYKRRATIKALKIFGPRDRPLVEKAIREKNVDQFNSWIRFLQKRMAELTDPKRRQNYGEVADVLAVLRDNPGGKTLKFAFDPQNTLDLGTRKFGGRILPAKHLKALIDATKSFKGSVDVGPALQAIRDMGPTPQALLVYRKLQDAFGYKGVNQIVQAAGFDSIAFVHEGNQALKSPRYPVMVALDFGAPTRVMPGQKKAPAPKSAASAAGAQPAAAAQPASNPNPTPQQQRQAAVADVRSAVDAIKGKMKQMSTTAPSMGFDPELFNLAFDLARSIVKLGVIDFKEFVRQARNRLPKLPRRNPIWKTNSNLAQSETPLDH
jgi:hypothetical protein